MDGDGAPSDLTAVPYGTCHFGISLPTGRTQSLSLLQKDWKEKRGETPFAILSGSVRQQHVLCPGLHLSEAVSVVTVRWVTICEPSPLSVLKLSSIGRTWDSEAFRSPFYFGGKERWN